jgi:hypothetical protein
MKRILFVLIAASGCTQQLYPGSALEDVYTSRIETRGIDVHAVDGTRIESDSRAVEVMPGRHVIEATVVSTNGVKKNPLNFALDTEAGRTYYLAGSSTLPNCIRVQDETGNIVFEDKVGCSSKIVKEKNSI